MPNKEMGKFFVNSIQSLTILSLPNVIEMLVISRQAACNNNLDSILILAINLSSFLLLEVKESEGRRPQEAREDSAKLNCVSALSH